MMSTNHACKKKKKNNGKETPIQKAIYTMKYALWLTVLSW